MNMISTGAFLTEMDSSNEQSTVAEKFAAVWEKKNAKAARAGGVSLMALSLAACGSSSTTTTTTTTDTTTSTDTTTTTTTTDAAKVMKLTVRDDTGSDFTGGSGDDTFDGYSTSASLTNGDNLDGGAGTDTLAAFGLAAGTIVPVTTGVEVVELRSASNTAIVQMDKMTGVTNVVNDQSGNTLGLTKYASGVALEVKATGSAATNVTMADATGSADSFSLSVSGDNGVLTVDGIETFTITAGATHGASTGASLDGLDSNTLKTVNITSTANIDLGVVTQGSAANKAVTIDGSNAAGGFSVDVSDFNGTSAGASSVGNTITGSAGADKVEVDTADIDKYQTMSMGDGDDIIVFSGEFESTDTAKADWANISGFNTIELKAGTEAKAESTTFLDMSAAEGLDWVERVIMSSDNDNYFKDIKNGFVMEVKKGASGSVNTVNLIQTSTWEAGVNDATLKLQGFTDVTDANITAQGTLTIESNGAGSNKITAIDGVTTPKLVITGAKELDVNDGALSTTTVDVDASGMSGALLIEASTSATKITGGSGADNIVGGSAADTITGGAGNDTILGDEAADTIDGGAGDDTITAMVHATANDTITTGTGNDTVILEDHSSTNAVAFGATTIKDFDFGTSSTTVDTLKIANSMIEAGDLGGTITGALVDTSTNDAAAGDGTVVHITADGQTVANADIVVLSQTYASATAALTGMATAGLDTFNFGAALTDDDIIMVAFSDGTDSHIAVVTPDVASASVAANSTSDSFDAIDIFVTFEGVASLANFDSGDVQIIA